jgi:hypothetical protein
VLGGEERDQLEILVPRDQIDIGRPRTIDARVIRDESDAFSAQGRRHVGKEHFDPRLHGSRLPGRCLGSGSERQHDSEESEPHQRIATGATVDPVPPAIFSGCRTIANS